MSWRPCKKETSTILWDGGSIWRSETRTDRADGSTT